jgi:hypothetical protein
VAQYFRDRAEHQQQQRSPRRRRSRGGHDGEDEYRVLSVIGTPDVNQLTIQNTANFVPRLTGANWDTGIGPRALGLADVTQGTAGLVPMPTWPHELNGPDVTAGSPLRST